MAASVSPYPWKILVGQTLDEFEKDFQKARQEIKQLRELLENRFKEEDPGKEVSLKQEIMQQHKELSLTVNSMKKMVTKNKKYTEAEV